MKGYDIKLSELDMAVLDQLQARYTNTRLGCEIEDEAVDSLLDVARVGAQAGFNGFIYNVDCFWFVKKNRRLILDRLREQIAEGLFGETDMLDIEALLSYNILKGYAQEIQEAAAYALYFDLPDTLAEMPDGSELVCQALAWGALEDLAFRIDCAEEY